MPLIVLEGWSFIPGPARIANLPRSSIDLEELAFYEPAEVATCVLSIPGTRLIHSNDPTWWEWRAEWRNGDRFISLDMSLFDTEPQTWGGSTVEAICELDDILEFWAALRDQFPAIWLHNEFCDIHTPESFCRLYDL